MAHFAKIGMNGKVIGVLTCGNNDMKNADGVEDEKVGQQYFPLVVILSLPELKFIYPPRNGPEYKLFLPPI